MDAQFSYEPAYWFSQCLYKLTLVPSMEECSPCSRTSLSSVLLILAILINVRWHLSVVFIGISLMLKNVKHFLIELFLLVNADFLALYIFWILACLSDVKMVNISCSSFHSDSWTLVVVVVWSAVSMHLLGLIIL